MPLKYSSPATASDSGSTFFSRLLQGKKIPVPLKIVSRTTSGPESSLVCDFPAYQESRQLVEFAYSLNSTRPTSNCEWIPLPNLSFPRRSSSLSIQSTSSAFTVTSYATTPLSTPRLDHDDRLSDNESENNDYFDEDLVLFFSRPASNLKEVEGDDSEQLGFADMMLEGNAESATEASGRAGGEWERMGRLSSDVMDWDMAGVLSRKESEAFLGQAKLILDSKSDGVDDIETQLIAMGF